MPSSTGRYICQGLDGRPGADGGGSCAGAHWLRDQASPCSCDDCSGDCGKRALRLGYGVGEIEKALGRAGKGYVLVVPGNHLFRSWGKRPPIAGMGLEIAHALGPSLWKRLSAGDGTKGARLHDWAYCELADLDAAEYDDQRTGLWTRGLLIRRNIADDDMAFFSTRCPYGTSIETLVKVEGHRWAIEDSFETAKNELGLDLNESRSWHGWHRHVSLIMLAFAMTAAIRHHANATPPPKTNRRKTTSKTTKPHRH